jgi:hypothetical protein
MSNKRIQCFINNFSNVKLEEFYQLPNTQEQKVEIKFKVETLQIIHLSIHYKKNYVCPLFNLPPELIRHIKGYLPDFIKMELKATIPNGYPFKPNIWEISALNSNMKINQLKYYDIIKHHNCYNIADWSPSMSLDKDILSLIEKLYDYLYINKSLISI